jgi:hypothetical protein
MRILFSQKEIFYMNEKKGEEPFSLKENIFSNKENFIHECEKSAENILL